MLSYSGAQLSVRLVNAASGAAAAAATDNGSADDGSADDDDTPDTVHCFSLASGLLYERFLRIMMASASERSSAPLHFWLLGNFLSPGFRAAVHSGALAEAVGAKVSIVTYSWPKHLRYQSEKQRLIWGCAAYNCPRLYHPPEL